MAKRIIWWLGLCAICVGCCLLPKTLVAAATTDEDLIANGMWTENVTSASVDKNSNSELLSRTSTVIPYFKMASVTTSGVRSTGDQVVINQDATLTFVIQPQSFSTRAYGNSYGNSFDKFTLVLSTNVPGKWLDFNTAGVTAHDGSLTGRNPVPSGQTYIPISSDANGLIQNEDQTVTVKRPIYITVNLKQALEATGVTGLKTLKISQQFNNSKLTNGATFIKTVTGTLDFSLTLKPTLANVFMFPTPITVDGVKYTGIVTGTGTLAGDAIHWATNSTATKDSPTISEKVPASKKWLWIVPASAGIKAGDKLSVLETSPQNDSSTTDESGIDQSSKYLDNTGGRELLAKLTDLIEKFKAGTGDPTALDTITNDIVTTLDQIDDAVSLQKQVEQSATNYKVTFDNDQDYFFKNQTSNSNIVPASFAKISDQTIAHLVAQKNQTTAGQITWRAYQHGTAMAVDSLGTGAISLTPSIFNGQPTCRVSVDKQGAARDLKSIDLVAMDSSNKVVGAHEVTLTSLAVTPNPIDMTQTHTANLQLINLPTTLSNAQFTWHKISAITGAATSLAQPQATLPLAQLSYLNNGDWYQVTVTQNKQTVASNVVQLQLTGQQGPHVSMVPKQLNFTNNGVAPRLDQIINGTFKDWQQPLTATSNSFGFGSHIGTGVHWTVSAAIAPFQSGRLQEIT